MKLSWILMGISCLGLFLSYFIIKDFNNFVGFFSLFLSIATFILAILWRKEDSKTFQLKLDEDRLHTFQIIEKVEKAEEKVIEKFSKGNEEKITESKIKQLMFKVTSELKKENFSKDLLLKELDKPIYCILIHKTEEDNIKDHKIKTIRDSILPSLGFKHLKMSRGIYVLPPSNTPSFKSRKDLEKWIEKNIYKKVPDYHRYIFSFIGLIDLRLFISIKKDQLTKKPYQVLLDAIDPEEILNFSEGLNYLQKKKNLSIKDLINIPNIEFLLENTSLDIKKRNIISKNNEKIIENVKRYLGREIFTKDLSLINSEKFKEILLKYVDLTLNDVEKIKENAKFWKDFLENNISF